MIADSPQAKNRARLWREPAFAGAEMLRAAYRTHKFPPHTHDEFAFGVIERGAQSFQDGRGERTIMPQGTICVINPGQMHEGRPTTDVGWDYRMVYFSADGLTAALGDANLREIGADLYFPNTVIDDPDTLRLLLDAHVCSESADASRMEKASRLTQVIYQLALRHGQSKRLTEQRLLVPGSADQVIPRCTGISNP